ncbi:MAG: helicase C-terminal domain-containing protein [Bacillota bacterium]
MAANYVVVDLETTGLDPQNNKIIEISAVKIHRGIIREEFSFLVNPQMPLAAEITALTGIIDVMLADQPLIEQIIPDFQNFIGNDIIIAHNASFDRSFLEKYLQMENDWIDSIILAQIVFPTAGTYSLDYLCRYLGISNKDAHRSLSDAKATAELFCLCLQQFSRFSWPLKRGILELAKEDDSALGRLLIQEALKDPQVDQDAAWEGLPGVKKEPKQQKKRESCIDEEFRLDIQEIEKYLTSQDLCGEHIESFETRPQQLEMALAVAKSFNNRQFLLAEAGTGTGKSLAYLLPAVLFSLRSGQQIGISTHTISLQEQLLKKEIPQLQGIIKEDFRAAVLKGRGNYLCLNLFYYFYHHADDNLRYFLMRVLVWLEQTSSGDGGELGLGRFENWKWQLISAGKENCVAPACRFCKGQCFVSQSRRQAETADIVIVNNALLVADAAMEKGVLPNLSYLIIDEAHHLEKAAEEQLSASVDFYTLLNILSRLKRREKGKSSGVLQQIKKQSEKLFFLSSDQEEVANYLLKAEDELQSTLESSQQFFSFIKSTYHEAARANDYYPARLLIEKKDNKDSYWQNLEALGQNLYGRVRQESKTLFSLLDLLTAAELQTKVEVPAKDQLKVIASLLRNMADTIESWLDHDDNYVIWLEFAAEDKLPSLHIAPLELGQILYDNLFKEKASVIMTSATLSAAGSFAYFKKNIGLDLLPDPAIELQVNSPFFYSEQALFTICTDLPDWTKESEVVCIDAIGCTLIKLLEASSGRAVVLFTSHAQLKAVYNRIKQPLAQKGIDVLAHGINGNPHQLLQRLKKEEKCCILGASSFWEGIDVVGSALSLLVVVRLPFWPPTNPILSARVKRMEAEGINSFKEYSLPQSIIRFKQGFGRLIRSGYDKGVFCVLDKRIVEKFYGRYFIDSLPDMEIICADHEEIAEHVRKWLD